MEHIILALATGSRYGREPGRFMPIWLFFAAFFCCFVLSYSSFLYSFFAVAALFITGVCIAGMAEKIIDTADSDSIILDQFVGLCIALTSIPAPKNPFCWLLGYALFFFLNRVKPFPANWIKNHLNGGFAIMIDDIVVGGYVFICLRAIWWFFL